MGCYYPMHGYMRQDASGRRFTMSSPRSGSNVEYTPQTVPCGSCTGCRASKAKTWAMRCMHESQMHEHNSFITLTYRDEHLPVNLSLDYDHFQEFMKRLRVSLFRDDRWSSLKNRKIRFYMAGEYGSKLGRPHFHAILFGVDFPDRRLFKKTESGSLIYTSALLEELWPFGFSSVGDVTFQSAGYVARYIHSKITGRQAYMHYATFDESGQLVHRTPEFNKMSLKPGVGKPWYDKYHKDVFPHDYVVIQGRKCRPPRYYDKLYLSQTASMCDVESHSIHSDEFDELKFNRAEFAKQFIDDNTPDRLLVKETIAKSRLNRLPRTLT